MPYKPTAKCRVYGCNNKCEQGRAYCREHLLEQQRDYNKYQRDQEVNAFYHSREWRMMRESILKESPLCAMCLANGRYVIAKVVDHIKPISQGGERLNRENLQPLCNACHEKKSQEEGSRFGRGPRGVG